MNEKKALPKWLKITLGVVPLLLIVGMVVFGGDIIGGQGLIKKDLVTKKTSQIENISVKTVPKNIEIAKPSIPATSLNSDKC